MAKDSLQVLMIARPGPWRDSLRVLLRASGRVAHIEQADNGPSGQCLLQRQRFDLVLLDAGLPTGQVAEILQNGHPACLVFTHDRQQEQQARQAGAAAILADGFSTETFFQALLRLMVTGLNL
jgi:DNA-binding NarL/FixJ family response regulator